MKLRHILLTQDIDIAGGGGNAMSVFHLDGEVAMICSDSLTDHQCRLALLGLIQTKTLMQGGHKLLLWFWDLQQRVLREIVFFLMREHVQTLERTQTLDLVFFFTRTGITFLTGSLVTSSSFLNQVTFGYGDPEI